MRFDQYLEGTFKFDGVFKLCWKKKHLKKLSEELDTVIFFSNRAYRKYTR